MKHINVSRPLASGIPASISTMRRETKLVGGRACVPLDEWTSKLT